MVIWPSLRPLQLIGKVLITGSISRAEGCDILWIKSADWHPFSSWAIIVYAPADSKFIAFEE